MNADLENFCDKGFCPYCGGQYFETEAQIIQVPEFEVECFLNTCKTCAETSIHNEGNQYKKL